MRAVEEGLPFIRAANTGISAIIDGNGRLISHLGLGETNILDRRFACGALTNTILELWTGDVLVGLCSEPSDGGNTQL